MYGYVIFTDIEKYSTLKDADLKIFFNQIIPIISEELKEYKDGAIIWNTWGDAIFAIYDKAETAINMALAYRETFGKIDFEKFGIRKLNPRIAGHFGEFEIGYDPVSGKQNVHGTLVNLTARIEPVTTPGEIFVTKEFKDMSISSYDKVDNVRFEDMGEIKLPKNAGQLNLYRLCKRAEQTMRPAGIINSKIDYQIQAPTNFSAQKPKKNMEKSIEERLSGNTNAKKTFSEEKLNKIATVLKDEKILAKKTQRNYIKDFFIKLKIKKNFKKFPVDNLFTMAFFIFAAAMFTNYIIDTVYASLNLNLPISSYIIEIISPWMWMKGFIIGSFLVALIATFAQKKLIKIQNIIIAPILAEILYMIFYVLPSHSTPASIFFMNNIYLNFFALWFVSFLGFSSGTEIANDILKGKK